MTVISIGRPVELALSLDVARACLRRYLACHPSRDPSSAFGPTRAEVEDALRTPRPLADTTSERRLIERALATLEDHLDTTPDTRLARVVRRYQLSSLDLEILCVALAPELDYSLERAYAYALDDITRKRPDVGFYARVIGCDAAATDRVLERLERGAPLRKNGVIAVEGSGPLGLRLLHVTDRILAYVRGHDPTDEDLVGFTRFTWAAPDPSTLVIEPELLDRIAMGLSGDNGPPRMLIAGQDGIGRALAVESILASKGLSTMRIDLGVVASDPRAPDRLGAAIREAVLRDLGIIFEAPGVPALTLGPVLTEQLVSVARELPLPMVFVLRDHPMWLGTAIPSLVELDLPPPSFRHRLEMWRRELPPALASSADLETVAGRYAFTHAMIVQTARRATNTARLRKGPPRVTLDDLGDAASLMFSRRMGGLAQRIPTKFSWDDLVLPRDTHEAVQEVVRFARHRAFLLEDWGFDAKLPYGRGVSAILAGPPGTGKTMVAQLIAKELGYDLYRIDLSQVVDKYVGETEKNLGTLFDQAEESHAVLFFDEADSLFAKRTNVQSSSDRYANLEVNYLLQRMEVYDGVTLLATNLSQGIDDAFRRRVRFSVAFELPDEPERKRLWRSMFPSRVPLAPDIDWDALARGFAMAGGYIKKAAIRAALSAVETRRPITTADLLEAARFEYREMGRIA